MMHWKTKEKSHFFTGCFSVVWTVFCTIFRPKKVLPVEILTGNKLDLQALQVFSWFNAGSASFSVSLSSAHNMMCLWFFRHFVYNEIVLYICFNKKPTVIVHQIIIAKNL